MDSTINDGASAAFDPIVGCLPSSLSKVDLTVINLDSSLIDISEAMELKSCRLTDAKIRLQLVEGFQVNFQIILIHQELP